MYQIKVVKNINTHILSSSILFPENRAVYEIVCINSPQMTIWHMRIAFWIRKATDTFSEYVTFIAFPLQQWMHECASMLRDTCIASLLFFSFIFCYVILHLP